MRVKVMKSVSILICLLMICVLPMFPQKEVKANSAVIDGTTISLQFLMAVIAMVGGNAVNQGNLVGSYILNNDQITRIKNDFIATSAGNNPRAEAFMNAQSSYLAKTASYTSGLFDGAIDKAQLTAMGFSDIYNSLNSIVLGKKHPKGVPAKDASWLDMCGYDYAYTMGNVAVYRRSGGYGLMSDYTVPTTGYNTSEAYYSFSTDYSKNITNIKAQEQYGYYDFTTGKSGDMGNVTVKQGASGLIYEITMRTSVSADVAFNVWATQYGINYNTGDTILPYSQTQTVAETFNLSMLDCSSLDSVDVVPALPRITQTTSTAGLDIAKPTYVSGTSVGSIPFSYAPTVSVATGTATTTPGEVSEGVEADVGSIASGVAGIGASIGALTGSIADFFKPSTETINFDKLKGVSALLFNKFPFSIPFDFYHVVTMFNAPPVAPCWQINADMSGFGIGVVPLSIDLSPYDNYAPVMRMFNLISFVIFMLFATKSLIWK